MIDEVSEQTLPLPASAEQAYDQAKAGMELGGVALQPWSPARVVAANSIGLVWPLPPEAMDQLQTTGIHAGAMVNAIVVCWLRLIPNASEQTKESVSRGEWNVQRATRAPREAFEAALQWAAENKITDVTSNEFAHAYRVALATLLGVSLSEFEVEAPKDSKAAEGADPNV